MDIGRVLGRIGPHMRQQAFVVDDIGVAKASMRSSFGCRQFFEFESTTPWAVGEREVQCDLHVAFGRSGNMMIELIQPLRGEGVHFDLLRQRGPGAHHLGFFVDDFEEQIEFARQDGFGVAMSGSTPVSRYCYLDTLDSLGVYLELIDDPKGMMFRMMPWWDEPYAPEGVAS